MSPSAFRSLLIAAGVSSVALFTSCNSTSRTSSKEVAFSHFPGAKRQSSVTVAPSKARRGAKPIEYYIIEIKVPDDSRENNFLTGYIRESQKNAGAARRRALPAPDKVRQPKDLDAIIRLVRASPEKAPTVPGGIFPSLRELSRTKGVDLMNVGKAREGQTLRSEFSRPVPFADEFSPDGKPLSWTTGKVGVESSFHGVLEDGGHTINMRGSFDCKELTGFTTYRLPSGPEVLQPVFNRRAAAFDPLRIPNGGFAILAGPDRNETETTENHYLGGLIRTKRTRNINCYLAVGATSEPL